jgi:hypothetical protein
MSGGRNPQPQGPGGADPGPPGKPDAPRARLRFRWRRLRFPWLTLFFFAGLVAILATVVMAVDFWAGLPWFDVAAPLASLAGYRIWRAKHPGESARRALASFLAIPAAAFVPALILTEPTLRTVVIAVGLAWLAVVSIALLILALVGND